MMIDSTQILHFILKYFIDDPKLRVLSFNMEDTDYRKLEIQRDTKQLSEQKELILKILETLWLVPEHIDFNKVGYANDSVFEECIAFFVDGDFIAEDNVIFLMRDKRDYISNILSTFYEEFPIEGIDINDSRQISGFNEFVNSKTLCDIKEFWTDVKELLNLFYCQNPECKRRAVSIRNYDTVAKKIRCGCDTTKYDWKNN
jgi:hypothetical protein